MDRALAYRLLTDPIVWIVGYLLYRVLFTNPGRRPLDEDMTSESD
jgi:hypothetical protein